MSEGWARKLHRYADRMDRRIRPALSHTQGLERAWIGILDAIVARQPDRAYLRKAILPAVAAARPARVLFVGVRGYTTAYGRAFRAGTEFWTTDIDPEAARYGAPGRHVTADVRRLDQAFAAGSFPFVLMNGVFGWGVDDPGDMDSALAAVERVLAPGGVVLFGWNGDRCADPDSLPAMAMLEPIAFAGLPQRKTFRDVTHIYAWYKTRRAPAMVDAPAVGPP
jgi:SAM-dependent methyltransferase